MKQLSDTDAMPFGKFKGIPMEDVPARYLFWLWTDCDYEHKSIDESNVADYIRRNLDTLEADYPDGIWRNS